jgi:O-acetyl-ADP-ribose deacetylase (regulator of RNase III)
MAAKNIAVTSDLDVLRYVRQQPGRYALFMGAGASLEADVLTADQICRDIRHRLEQQHPSRSQDDLDELLNWNDPRRRYSTCLMRYGRSAAQRVAYFRELLKAKQPAFCHHSTALLMKRGILRRTCLTTNFDKLIEVAFAQQGGGECQPIRSREEAMFWDEEDADKCYVVKLHGDYDTHNILNTRDETLRIEDDLEAIAGGVLEDAGLIVLGAAGHEDSVIRLFDDLTSRADRRMLSMGLFWRVYVGPAEEERPADAEVEERVRAAIESGSVSQEIVEMVSRANTSDRESAFFPVWGAGTFLLALVRGTDDRSLKAESELYLDHRMRLRSVFARAGLTREGIDKHLEALEEQQRRVREQTDRPAVAAETAWIAEDESGKRALRVVYGDITSRSLMGSLEFDGRRRAVVSPEDTCISAGGGVAYALLEKAGHRMILNELSKLAPIRHREVAVTSGGDLPVHFILHAAALKIEPDASYTVSQDDVLETMAAVLACVAPLGIEVLFVPLLAAGVGPLSPRQSVDAILQAIGQRDETTPLEVVVAIFKESIVPRDEVGDSLQAALPAFSVHAP